MPHHFPPRWTVEQIPGGYKIKDANGQALAMSMRASRDAAKVMARLRWAVDYPLVPPAHVSPVLGVSRRTPFFSKHTRSIIRRHRNAASETFRGLRQTNFFGINSADGGM